MQFIHSIPFSGNLPKAFDFVASILIANDFEIVSRSEISIELSGTGMTSTKDNPLLGATEVHFYFQNSELRIEAELGGVKEVERKTIVAIGGLYLILAILFSSVIHDMRVIYILLALIGPFFLYPLIVPLMTKWMRTRTANAYEKLMESMVVAGDG